MYPKVHFLSAWSIIEIQNIFQTFNHTNLYETTKEICRKNFIPFDYMFCEILIFEVIKKNLKIIKISLYYKKNSLYYQNIVYHKKFLYTTMRMCGIISAHLAI